MEFVKHFFVFFFFFLIYFTSHSKLIVKIGASHTCKCVCFFRSASYLPITYSDWVQDKDYTVPSECAGRDYHLKSMTAVYLHLQTRSPTHVLTVAVTVHICYKNFILHTEGISLYNYFCMTVTLWSLGPWKGSCISLYTDWKCYFSSFRTCAILIVMMPQSRIRSRLSSTALLIPPYPQLCRLTSQLNKHRRFWSTGKN